MKTTLSTLLILIITVLAVAQKPQKIVSFAIEDHDCDWYTTQTDLWGKEIAKDSLNADAWMNYYLASRYKVIHCTEKMYYPTPEEMQSLTDILNEMKNYVPKSYEYNYLMYYNGGKDPEKNKYLLKAYEIDPERTEIYGDLIVYYEINGKYNDKKLILQKRENKEPASPGMMAWNYNTLYPLDEKAIILTYGDNDTYQKWTLQEVYGVRKDVQVINMSLAMIEEYRNRLFEEAGIEPFTMQVDSTNYMIYSALIVEHICKNSGDRPVYISASMSEDLFKDLKDSLYLEGLVYKYSEERYDNIAVIKRFYEKEMLKDYIVAPIKFDRSKPIVDRSNLNYIPAFIQLYDHYKLSGEKGKAEDLGELIIHIARESGNENYREYVTQYIQGE
ncbi:MAG: hypothetical protein C0592_10035 [Marinilabiliales bacterium]|nr:MAG: hypothetical protein C0592_10035 [Marinilabiliales bacterium]